MERASGNNVVPIQSKNQSTTCSLVSYKTLVTDFHKADSSQNIDAD